MRSRSLALLSLVAVLLSIAVSCNRDPEVAKRRYLESGEKYMQQGRYEEAVIRFENALNIDPKFVDAYYKLARADAALGRWNESYNALQHAIEIDPSHTDSLLALGELYLAARDFPKAEESARNVISRDASNAAAYQLLGAALTGEQKNDDGLAAFNKIKELRPKDPSSYVNAALVEVSMQKFDAGEADLRKAIEVDSHYWPASMDLANLYRLQGKIEQADSVLEQGIAESPDATNLYVTRASLRWDAGDVTGASQILDQIRSRQPKSAEVAAKIGDFYAGQKDLGKALSEYQRGLGIDGANNDIKKRIIDLFLATGRVSDATRLTDDILKQNPKDNQGRVFQADIALAQGRTTEAVNTLRQVIADAPELAQAHYVLGEAYWKNGDPQQADGEFLESLKNDVNSTMTLKKLAELHMTQGDLQGARDYALRLIQLSPAEVENRLLLASVYQRRNEWNLAYEQLQIAQKIAPTDATTHLYLAQTYAAARQWKQAEAEYDAALKQQPQSSDVLSAYVDYFVNRGQPASGISVVKQHLASYPNDSDAHVTLGSLYLTQKKYDDAGSELRRALELNPSSTTAHLRLGQLLQQQDQLQAAVNEFQAALRIQPNFPPLITLVGNIYLDQGNLAEARKYYEQALAVDPHFAIAQSNLAFVIAKTGGNLDVALGLAQAAKREMPDLDSLSDTLGWIEYQRRSYSSAVSTLNDCVQRSPNNARCRYHLGMALYQSGDSSGARQQLEAALRMNLQPEDAEQARAVLAKSR